MTLIYSRLSYVYLVFRVVLPFIDTGIIVHNTLSTRGRPWIGVLGGDGWPNSTLPDIHASHIAAFPHQDWTQLYFWAMAVLDVFNLYFYFVIRSRARMPAHVLSHWEERTGCN